MKEENQLPPSYVEILKENAKVIKEIYVEEEKERIETLDSILNRMTAERNHTNLQKEKFISLIKDGGLGEVIRQKPNEIEFVKRSIFYKIRKYISNVFKKI